MLRRILPFALVLTLAASGPVDVPDFNRRVIRFEQHWNIFVRKLVGCKASGDTTRENCTLPTYTDYKEFKAACEAARQLFGFEEPCRSN